MCKELKHNEEKLKNIKKTLPVSPIEFLEYSKDNIRKVKHWNDLPDIYEEKLRVASRLLSETQEFLFYN